jgi:hypothetical protein
VADHATLAIANVAGHATLAIANVARFLATLANAIYIYFFVSTFNYLLIIVVINYILSIVYINYSSN